MNVHTAGPVAKLIQYLSEMMCYAELDWSIRWADWSDPDLPVIEVVTDDGETIKITADLCCDITGPYKLDGIIRSRYPEKYVRWKYFVAIKNAAQRE